MASTMPHSIDLGDLVQDGVLGLIDAANRFDADRGIKFETFAERRVRGAMIDALRRDAWPRGVRRVRRELEAAREQLRRELGAEPTLSDLARRVGSDEARLERTIVRINTIESTSPLANFDSLHTATLPAVLVPSEPPSPDRLYEQSEVRDRVRAAMAMLPARERRIVTLLLRRSDDEANRRRDWRQRIARVAAACAGDPAPQGPAGRVGKQAGAAAPAETGAGEDGTRPDAAAEPAAAYCTRTSRAARTRSRSLNGFGIHRHPLSERNRPASVPATSPVMNTTRRARAGSVAEISVKNAMPSTFGIFKSQMITS
jgi:RNA polymerase sigma factor for flagellar operon FliA